MDINNCILSNDGFEVTEDCEAWLHNLFPADSSQQLRIEEDFQQQFPIEECLQALSGSHVTFDGPSLSGECDIGSSVAHSKTSLRCSRENKRRTKTLIEKTRSTEKEGKVLKYGFRTRSDKEAADDGYKWRKYGRKSLKCSPHPRNYYRCRAEKCKVKKRVEKDPADNGMIIVTYEGFHNHECPSASHYCLADI